MKSLSHVWLLATPWTAAYQPPPSMGFSRQEYWSGVPLPSPMTNLDTILKSRAITLLTKVCRVKAMVFPVVTSCMNIRVGPKEGWVPKNWCFWIVMLEKTLESPMDSKENKPVNPKGNQPWIFIGRSDAEAAILWSPDAKSQLAGKDPDAGKDWRKRKRGQQKVRQYHRLNGHESEQTPGDSGGQRSLACCSSWGCKELDTTELLNWTDISLPLSCCCSVLQSCPTLFDPMECSMPGFPVLHHLPEFAQTHVHRVCDAIQSSHPLLSPSTPDFNLS